MRINPVLKNEIKLSARSFKFTLVILFYVGILSAAGVLIFYNCIKNNYFEGLYLESIVYFYIGMAIIQAILLMFIVQQQYVQNVRSRPWKYYCQLR